MLGREADADRINFRDLLAPVMSVVVVVAVVAVSPC